MKLLTVPEWATHTGLMFGIVPVWLNMNDEAPMVDGRFIGCNLLLTVCERLFAILVLMVTMVNDEYEPMFPIKITGEL